MASSSRQPTTGAQPFGEVYDRGYQHYDGRREGRAHAIGALIFYSLRRGLGIRKRWTAKIIPLLLYAAAFLPVFFSIGLRAFLGQVAAGFELSNFMLYHNLYQLLSLILLVFAVATAPEMLCDDRREHVLPLYFSRAIYRSDYLLAKMGALGLLIGSFAFLPALLLFIGNVFLDAAPLSYLGQHLGDLARILAAGTTIALFYTAIALVVPAYVERKGVASATAVGGILVVAAIAGALFDAIQADWHRYLVLANPVLLLQGAVLWIFDVGTAPDSSPQIVKAALYGGWYVLAVVLLTLVCGAIMYRRYVIED